MKKILFLDIDGVICTDFKLRVDYELSKEMLLNQNNSLFSEQFDYYAFNSTCIRHLNKIVQHTNCDIVISSSWRKTFTIEGLQYIFEQNDFNYSEKIIDVTCTGYKYIIPGNHFPVPRGLEIKIWIDLNLRKTSTGFNNENYSYCIIDDDSDMLLEQKDNFIKTNFKTGLCFENVKPIIDILNK